MTNVTEVTYFAESGRTRFANFQDGRLISVFWKEDAGDRRNKRVIGKRATLDTLDERD